MDRFKADLQTLQVKFQILQEVVRMEDNDSLYKWVDLEMDTLSAHRPAGFKEELIVWNDPSVKRILLCLTRPERYFPFFWSKGTPLEKNLRDQDKGNLRRTSKWLRAEFYAAMKKHPAGIALLEKFEPLWNNVPVRAVPSAQHNVEAIAAHIFILLSFWEDPD